METTLMSLEAGVTINVIVFFAAGGFLLWQVHKHKKLMQKKSMPSKNFRRKYVR